MGVCRIPRPREPAAAAKAEVVELLFTYVERLRAHFTDVAAAHDLTPIQAKVILSLGEPEPMNCIAHTLGCDPSNITAVVDRLEERGLLTRAESPGDRRVKHLQATAAGLALRDEIGAGLFRDVPGMSDLTRAQVANLRDVLAALCHEEAAPR